MTSFSPPPTAKPTTQEIHVQPPPQDNHLIAEIMALLVAGYAAHKLAELLTALLKSNGILITAPVVQAALGLASRGSAHRPNARLAAYGIVAREKAADIPRAAAAHETGYRAAYFLAAAKRLNEDVTDGMNLREAIGKESRNFAAHERARRNRLAMAARVSLTAALFGPLLGWYRNPESNSEAECLIADGHNFYADEGTIIGYPGAVHPACRCEPGPPHEPTSSVQTVDEAIHGTISMQNKKRRKTPVKPRSRETA